MIIVLRPSATEEQIQHIHDRVRELGFQSRQVQGQHRSIIGVIGDDNLPQTETLAVLDGVEQVLRILKPYKLASRELHREDTIVHVGTVAIGGGSLALIAGPCAVESLDGLRLVAKRVKAAGANMLRGGAFKPRTSPYSFQGIGLEGLKMLQQVGKEVGLPVVTEVMNVRQVETVCEHADMLQIGARNMQNYDLLREIGQAKRPILLKRGLSATVKDLLMSAEYVLSSGNSQVVLCERGVRSFEDSTRNMLDLSAVPNVKSQCHLPIIVDPSHATGRADLVPAMAQAAIAAGADGIMVEVHECPERALSDGVQALVPDRFDELMGELRRVMAAVGKEAG
jgi:3-deoxy-7-phosphoheptulonate synthase